MPDYTRYRVKVSTITPLHIGNGRELWHEYDYAIHNKRTWRINENVLLDAQDVDDPKLAARLARLKPVELLNPSDFRWESPYFRYVLEGTPRSGAEGAQLREQFKDAFDRPYLPGTSLKGALRTALAWHAWGERRLRPDAGRLGRSPKWAGQSLEQQLLGRDPNHDLLRALQVGDSATVAADRLMIVNARVLTRGGNLGSPIELEALRPDTQFELTLKIDQALFSTWAQKAELPRTGRNWLTELAQTVQAHSAARIRSEMEWFGQIREAAQIHGLYQRLERVKPGGQQCLIQLGWGTGWEDKTFGSRLQVDSQFMERIIRDYRLARGRRQIGDRFPKSRRVAAGFRGGEEYPATPLGWALMEMEKIA